MFELDKNNQQQLEKELVANGYWLAQAAIYFQQKKYSKTVEICKTHLTEQNVPLSSRILFAKALFHAGQIESAETNFFSVLSSDPDNLVALKYLGDIKFSQKLEFEAFSFYSKILSIDPYCTALTSLIKTPPNDTTKTITLKRATEDKNQEKPKKSLRNILFYTETVGDLYLVQGYPRLAEEVFIELQKYNNNPRIAEKLSHAREKIKEKDTSHVKKTD